MDIEMIAKVERILNIIKSKVQISGTHYPDFDGFEMLSNINKSNIKSWEISHKDNHFVLSLLGFNFDYSSINNYTFFDNNKGEGHKLVGFVTGNVNLGKTLIRPETFFDKVSEVFNSVEVDFKNHKKFSQKYFVVTNDKELLVKNFPTVLMDFISDYDKVSLEFDGNRCAFVMGGETDQACVTNLVNFGIKLHHLMDR